MDPYILYLGYRDHYFGPIYPLFGGIETIVLGPYILYLGYRDYYSEPIYPLFGAIETIILGTFGGLGEPDFTSMQHRRGPDSEIQNRIGASVGDRLVDGTMVLA